MKFVLASQNGKKVEELSAILSDMNIQILTMSDVGFKDEIEENGTTFEENALIKAKTLMEFTRKSCIADDSGLEVFSLDGRPGIYSARYAGENATDSDRNAKLIEDMKGIDDDKRQAQFVCAVACVFPDGKNIVVRGTCQGCILKQEIGQAGFGYDPLFYVDSFKKTYAQMTSEEKNCISHRSKALSLLKEELLKLGGSVC